MKTIDDILKEIGEFGPYQKKVYFFMCLPAITLAGMLVINAFILGIPKHRCKLPDYDNDTYEIHGDFHSYLVNVTIPPGESEDQTYDQCHYWKTANATTERVTCSEWVYDTSVYKLTFSKKLDMVCDDAIKVPNAQMIFYFGVLVGSYGYGQLSDVIGRKKTMYLCVLILLGSSVGLVAMVEYIGFCVMMFVIGGSAIGLYLTSYVIGMELVGPSKRLWTGNFIELCFTNGVMYLVLMVYLIRDWRYFTLAVALQGCLYLPYYWFIPESCRWLLSKGKLEDVKKILLRVAASNKTTLNDKHMDELPGVMKIGRVWQLFSTRRLAARTAIIYFNWMVCGLAYYGVILNIGNLGGSLFLNFALLTAVEYPCKVVMLLLLDRIGRRKLFMGFMLLGGVACLVTIWPIMDGSDNLHPLLIGLAMFGKMCVAGAFGTVYLLSAELFPTVVRNVGMGSSSAVARVGAMVAPYIAKSADLVGGTTGKIIPMALFGAFMVASGLLTTILPETLNRELPESIEDADTFTRNVPKTVEVYIVPKSDEEEPDEEEHKSNHIESENL